jgi:hypothetical protein
MCAHVVVIGAGIVTYLLVHDALAVRSVRLAAVAGCFVAAGCCSACCWRDGCSPT